MSTNYTIIDDTIHIELDEDFVKVVEEKNEQIDSKIIEKVIEEVLPKIPIPENGENGKDGKNWKTPTKTEIKSIIKPLIPKEKDIIEKVVKKIPKPKDGKDGEKWEQWEKMKFSDLTPYEKQILTWPPWNAGEWVPKWWTIGQKLVKKSDRNFDTEWQDSEWDSDEKVKYDASDPTAWYLADKIVAWTGGITVTEWTWADENKVKIWWSGSTMVYPWAWIPVSTWSAWWTSISWTSSQFIKGDWSLDSSTYALSSALSGYVPTSRTLTINWTSYDLSTNRTWSITDANLSTSDITTNDVSATKHGFFPKLPSITDDKYYGIKNGAVAEISSSWSGANTALSNLASVAINTTLLPSVDNGTVGLGSTTKRFGPIYTSSLARDTIPVMWGGVWHDNLMTSRTGFTCNSSSQLAVNGGAYASARNVRLDIVAEAWSTFSEFWLTGSAVFEQNTSDRNRVFLQNKYALWDGTGSSSSTIHWTEWYDDPDIYIPITMRSAYDMGNDYWLGIEPTGWYGEQYYDPSAWLVHTNNRHTWYLWDSVHSCNKLYIDNGRWEWWGYSYETTSNYRMFNLLNTYRGNHIAIGKNAGNEDWLSYWPSICIGENAGYNKSTAGSGIYIGNNAGGSNTNGSSQLVIWHGAGATVDGDLNIMIGTGTGSGVYGFSTSWVYVGNYISADFGNQRMILDTTGRNTVINTQRHALIRCTGDATNPHLQTLWLNGDVSVQWLNMIIDDDTWEPMVDDLTWEVLFAPAI